MNSRDYFFQVFPNLTLTLKLFEVVVSFCAFCGIQNYKTETGGTGRSVTSVFQRFLKRTVKRKKVKFGLKREVN